MTSHYDRKLHRLAVKQLSAAIKKRWRAIRPYDIPDWCPPELAELHHTALRACAGNRGQARKIIEDHIAKTRKGAA